MRSRQVHWLVAALLVVTALCAVACGSLSDFASGVLRRTVPTGDSTPALAGPVWSGQSARFTWEFETGLGSGYADWLVQQLHEFRVIERDSSHLLLAKTVKGDAYRLHVALELVGQRTYVRITLIALPD